MVAYSTSKAGVIGLVKAVGKEVMHHHDHYDLCVCLFLPVFHSMESVLSICNVSNDVVVHGLSSTLRQESQSMASPLRSFALVCDAMFFHSTCLLLLRHHALSFVEESVS